MSKCTFSLLAEGTKPPNVGANTIKFEKSKLTWKVIFANFKTLFLVLFSTVFAHKSIFRDKLELLYNPEGTNVRKLACQIFHLSKLGFHSKWDRLERQPTTCGKSTGWLSPYFWVIFINFKTLFLVLFSTFFAHKSIFHDRLELLYNSEGTNVRNFACHIFVSKLGFHLKWDGLERPVLKVQVSWASIFETFSSTSKPYSWYFFRHFSHTKAFFMIALNCSTILRVQMLEILLARFLSLNLVFIWNEMDLKDLC